MNDLSQKEPPPIKNENPLIRDLILQDLAHPKIVHPVQQAVHQLLVDDVKGRAEYGYNKHKMYLQPFNGRNALKDSYQEVMDLVYYIRQALYEETQSSGLVVTKETDFFKSGLMAVYVGVLDAALKIRFMIKAKDKNGKSNINTGDGGSSQELRNDQSNLIIPGR